MENSLNKDDDKRTETGSDTEEIEPKLKYYRVRCDLKSILTQDAVSCLAVHTKFMCIGTQWGLVYLLDHQGNRIETKKLRVHTVAVNCISIDANGDYIASCSDDGKVYINGLYSSTNDHDIAVGRLVRSVAIDPNYHKSGSGRRFLIGDERLVLYEKTFFSRLKMTVLCEVSHEGGVKTIKWSPEGNLVAWATHIGFRIFDIAAKTSLGLIKWSRSTVIDLKCNFCWKDKSTLLVGWADTVRVCAIKEKLSPQPTDISGFLVQLIYTFQTDFYVCGVGPLGDLLVVLGYQKEGPPERPQLHVIEPSTEEYKDICSDTLSLRCYQEFVCTQYSLECLVEENRFVIVSPKDIAVAYPYDADDRIDWLIVHCKYDKALEAVSCENVSFARHTVLSVGQSYLDYLLSQKEYNAAAQLCHKILGNNIHLWIKEFQKFARVNQLRALSKYLPLVNDFPYLYDKVLLEYLKTDVEGFLDLIKEWPSNLYNVPFIQNAVLEQALTDQKSNLTLLESLAILYSHSGKHDKALAMYIKIQNKGVFELIRKYSLFKTAQEMPEGLMDLDAEQSIAVMLDLKNKEIDHETVTKKLEFNRKYLYLYLDALDRKFPKVAHKYHGQLVGLYADFASDKLLKFLQKSDHYPIQEALDICQKRRFHEERAYLLELIGNTKEALALITTVLGNAEKALDFCKKHDDRDLWEDLINFSLSRPSVITFLLNRIGTYIDPRILVEKIEPGKNVPGLKAALVKMMQDYNLQVSIHEGCKQILVSDYYDLHHHLVTTQQKGMLIKDGLRCGSCTRPINIKGSKVKDGMSSEVKDNSADILIFNCSHLFHAKCLPADEGCMMCSSQLPKLYKMK